MECSLLPPRRPLRTDQAGCRAALAACRANDIAGTRITTWLSGCIAPHALTIRTHMSVRRHVERSRTRKTAHFARIRMVLPPAIHKGEAPLSLTRGTRYDPVSRIGCFRNFHDRRLRPQIKVVVEITAISERHHQGRLNKKLHVCTTFPRNRCGISPANDSMGRPPPWHCYTTQAQIRLRINPRLSRSTGHPGPFSSLHRIGKWWLPSFWRAELCDAGNVNANLTASISLQRDITGSYNSPLQGDWFFRNGFIHAKLG